MHTALYSYSRNKLPSYYTANYSQQKRAPNSLGKPQKCKKKKTPISLVVIATWFTAQSFHKWAIATHLDRAILLWTGEKNI